MCPTICSLLHHSRPMRCWKKYDNEVKMAERRGEKKHYLNGEKENEKKNAGITMKIYVVRNFPLVLFFPSHPFLCPFSSLPTDSF